MTNHGLGAWRVWFAALAAVACIACNAHRAERVSARPVADDRSQLFEITHRGFAAIQSHNPMIFGAFLAPEFVLRMPGSPDMNRAAFLEQIRTLPVTILAVEGEGLDVRVFGDAAVVTGVQRARVRIESREVVDSAAFTDVFVRRDGRWQMTLAHSVPLAPGAP